MGGPAARNERRLPLGLDMGPGGIVMLVCGGVALLGFPFDAFWPALIGLAEPRRQPRQRATVASTWQPPVAPA